jgi:hypothetical protein
MDRARWIAPVAALAAAVTGADAGTKALAAKRLLTVFHECAWRTPLLMAIIPFIMFTAWKARAALAKERSVWRWSANRIRSGAWGFYKEELSSLGAMIKDHPSMRWLVRVYDVAIALMVGGMLGNGIDALRLGGALDWIPLGRSMMNLADAALLLGLSFFQLATSFFVKAAAAHKSGKPLSFNPVSYLGLPLAGFFVAWAFGSAESSVVTDLVMKHVGYVYLMGFSMLVGSARFLAALVMKPFVSRFVAEEGEKARRAAPAAP